MKQSRESKADLRRLRAGEGLARPHPLSENILASCDGYWEWLRRRDPPTYTITGKYLFFSEDRVELVKIAIDELENNGFHHAKINMKGKNIGQYRYWKNDLDTLRGKYSAEFLSKLSSKQRSQFTEAETSSERRGA